MTKETVLNLISKYSTDFLLKMLSGAELYNHTKVVTAIQEELKRRGYKY